MPSKDKHSFPPSLEREIIYKVEGCLLKLNEQSKREFNDTLQEQRGEVVSAFGDSLELQKYQGENITLDEVQSFIALEM
ncbi:MAG: hypothetical protein ABFS56_17780 [Pseudomonadota bacterium]